MLQIFKQILNIDKTISIEGGEAGSGSFLKRWRTRPGGCAVARNAASARSRAQGCGVAHGAPSSRQRLRRARQRLVVDAAPAGAARGPRR